MFGRTPNEEDKKLAEVEQRLLDEMIQYGPDGPDYSTQLEYLEKVSALRKSRDKQKSIDPNTLILVGGNVVVALIIVSFERVHVLTSKATNFIMKSS